MSERGKFSVEAGASSARWRWCVVVGIFLVAFIPAGLSVWLNPHRPVWDRVGEVTLAEVRGWPAVMWIDARAADVYARDHVLGALNLTLGSWEAQVGEVIAAWAPERRVVVYCDGHGCQISREVAQRLRAEMGLTEVYVLTGGWDAWTGGRK